MYEKYLEQLEEAGKIRNLKERSINCYKNYVSYFLKYQNKNPEELACQDVRTFLLAKKEEGQWKELTLSGIEFIRRFLMHVPPRRFVRLRHYGLLCSRGKHKKLTLCRNLLRCKKYLSKLRDKEMPEILKQLYGINIYVCKSCGGHLGKPQLKIPQRC